MRAYGTRPSSQLAVLDRPSTVAPVMMPYPSLLRVPIYQLLLLAESTSCLSLRFVA